MASAEGLNVEEGEDLLTLKKLRKKKITLATGSLARMRAQMKLAA